MRERERETETGGGGPTIQIIQVPTAKKVK